jgi:hypothetical protein
MRGGKFAGFARGLRLFGKAPIAHFQLWTGKALTRVSDALLDLALKLIDRAAIVLAKVRGR